jgi:hypothetical protein
MNQVYRYLLALETTYVYTIRMYETRNDSYVHHLKSRPHTSLFLHIRQNVVALGRSRSIRFLYNCLCTSVVSSLARPNDSSTIYAISTLVSFWIGLTNGQRTVDSRTRINMLFQPPSTVQHDNKHRRPTTDSTVWEEQRP